MARGAGKSADEALAGEVLPLADACRFLERKAEHVAAAAAVSLRDRPLWLWGERDTVHRRPRGVVAIIGTWNYPVYLNGVQLIQALTAGNGVVWKPSEVAPASAEALMRLVRQAGYPEGLVRVLEPTRRPVGSWSKPKSITSSSPAPRPPAASSRGGARPPARQLDAGAVGLRRHVRPRRRRRAAGREGSLVRLDAEPRADVHRDPAGAGAPFALPDLHRGAASTGGRHPRDGAGDTGPGAAGRAAREGRRRGRRRCWPAATAHQAVVVDVRPEMAVCREASFAPLLAVLPFDTVDDALRSDAQCPYRSGASICRQTRPARGVGRAAADGMVTINDVIVPTAPHPALPFGGRAESGWGVTQGEEGLLEMTVPQVVGVRPGQAFDPHLDLTPGSGRSQADLARACLESSHAATLGQRLWGWVRLIRASWRRWCCRGKRPSGERRGVEPAGS